MAKLESMFLVPAEWMDEITARLDRIERNTADRTNEYPAAGEVYSPSEVAEKCGVTRNTVYGWIRKGRLRSVNTGGRVLIPAAAYDEFMEGDQG